jgi:hypothetical protein
MTKYPSTKEIRMTECPPKEPRQFASPGTGGFRRQFGLRILAFFRELGISGFGVPGISRAFVK